MSMQAMPIADAWSRRPSRPQPKILGVDLNSRRTTSLLLLFGTFLSAAILTGRYKIGHPDDHPYGNPTVLGLQAYQASFRTTSKTSSNTALGSSSTSAGEGSQEDWGDDAWDDDWGSLAAGDWDEDGEEETNGDEWLKPLQKEEWDPLKVNPAPLTEIALKSCVLPPGFYDLCAPASTPKEDATRGKWVRVDRDLNRRIGIYYLYLFERRLLPNSQAPVLTDIKLLPHSPKDGDLSAGGMWTEVSETLRQGVWPRMKPLFLHYKVTEQSEVLAARRASPNGNAGDVEPITELDVVYGGEEVRGLWGYEVMKDWITGGEDDDKKVTVQEPEKGRMGSRIAIRRAPVPLPQTPALRFSPTGNFKILQVADLHLSVGPGACRDLDSPQLEECKKVGADRYTLSWLEKALEEVKPDLVVLSGDQSNGQDTSWSSQSAILKWAPLLYTRKIPYAAIFGNHDGELDLSLEQQMALMRKLPYFIGEQGPEGVDGVGNYFRSIRSADSSNTTLFNLYFLDSHAIAKSLNPWEKGYDWLKASQINWFKGQSSRVNPIQRPYKPPAGSTTTTVRPPKAISAAPKQGLKSAASKAPIRPPTAPKRPPAAPLAEDPELVGDTDEGEEDIRRRLHKKRQDDDEELTGSADGEDDTLGGTVMPDDGSKVVDSPGFEDPETFADKLANAQKEQEKEVEANVGWNDGDKDLKAASSSSSTYSSPKEVEGPQGGEVTDEEDSALSPFDEDEDEFSDNTPTKLPDGPTKAKPMKAKPNAITFFHIPLPETYDAPVDRDSDGKRMIVGHRYEGKGAPKTNSGFFEQGLVAQNEIVTGEKVTAIDEFWEGEFSAPTDGRPEVKVVANGHCHISEDCRRIKGIWMCFGGGGSYAGYGKTGFARRFRVYELSDFGETVETYQLYDTMEKMGRTVLVGEKALD